ncbi:MAG: MBL fold metallo-hydrolase [Lachnospiraceae bacterium]|nr:MBL fold metallo-hydrolase [Lachnospiraceae bacterium]
MKVTFLGHSGFSVELEHIILLFDYYTGKLPQWPKDKALAVFASHSHPDHFNWRILRLAQEYERIHFFFGNDIRLSAKWLTEKNIDVSVKEKVTKLSGGRDAFWENGPALVKVHTLKSTDMGVAFVVESEGKQIYHAGDLNWWHWIGEPKEDNDSMGRAYRAEIDSIAGSHFDLSFVPLDPRLEECGSWGMKYFLEKTDSPLVFPMHMWGKYEMTAKYKETDLKEFADRIADVSQGGQEWNI